MKPFSTAFVIFIMTLNSYAATVYVNQAASGANNGTSWTDAYGELIDAINNAATGDDIWIAQGTYLPDWNGTSHTGDRTLRFSFTQNLSLYGGFNGTETLVTQRNWNSNPTILSGDLLGNDIISYPTFSNRSDNTSTLIYLSSPANVLFDGLIFSGGHRLSSDGGWMGTMALIGDGTFQHCMIKDNCAEFAAIVEDPVRESIFENCVFTHNVGNTILYAHDEGLTILNTTVAYNHATLTITQNNSMGWDICNSIFWGNTSDGSYSTQDLNIYYTTQYSSFGNNIVEGWTGSTGGISWPNNYANDPLFTSATDFHLQASSPAIDMGSNACSSNSLDIAGTTRIAGASVDIGAYEQPIALPVQLVYFNGWKTGAQNKLVWQSSSEVNNDFYTLEKSRDGIHFYPIAVVDGAGNSSTPISYETIDPDGEKSATYRLKQTNFHGSSSYSSLVFLQSTSIEIVSLYPNPTVDFIEVILQSNQEEEVLYGFTDVQGREYFQQAKVVFEGYSSIRINISGFASGTYFFYARTRSGTAKVFKTFAVK